MELYGEKMVKFRCRKALNDADINRRFRALGPARCLINESALIAFEVREDDVMRAPMFSAAQPMAVAKARRDRGRHKPWVSQ